MNFWKQPLHFSTQYTLHSGASTSSSSQLRRKTFATASAAMSDFGELVLVIGDFHIPQRASGIPEKFQRMFVPNKMQHVLCTGNLSTKEQYDELRSLAPNVHVVRGSFDDNSSFPDTKVIQIGQFKVGLVSGHQVVPWGDSQSLAMVRYFPPCWNFIKSFEMNRDLWCQYSFCSASLTRCIFTIVMVTIDAKAIGCRYFNFRSYSQKWGERIWRKVVHKPWQRDRCT